MHILHCNATKVWEELFRLLMSLTMKYVDDERAYTNQWTTWVRLHGGTKDEWFKLDHLKLGLSPHFEFEATLKNPTTFQALRKSCEA